MEETLKMAIAIIQIMHSESEIQSYMDSIATQKRAQISDLSVANLKAKLILHSIAVSQKEIYVESIKSGKSDLLNYPVSDSILAGAGEFIDNCIVNLRVMQFYIQDRLSITENAIDIFEANDLEKQLRIAAKENSDPLYLSFFTSRRFALYNSDILKRFTDFKNQIEDCTESAKQTAVIRTGTVTETVAAGLSSMVSFYHTLDMLEEACKYAIAAYQFYLFPDMVAAKAFTNRTYQEIKKDLEVLII